MPTKGPLQRYPYWALVPVSDYENRWSSGRYLNDLSGERLYPAGTNTFEQELRVEGLATALMDYLFFFTPAKIDVKRPCVPKTLKTSKSAAQIAY